MPTETSVETVKRLHDRVDAIDEKKVSWVLFVWAMGIILVAFGWIITVSMQASSKADVALDRVASVEGDIKGINSSLASINANLTDIKETLRGR